MRGASFSVGAGAWGAAVAAAMAVCAACSDDAGSGPRRPGDSTASGAGGTAGQGPSGSGSTGTSAGGNGNAGAMSSGTGPIIMVPDAGREAGFDPDAACTGEMRQGERLPLDMYFVLDESGSMLEDVMGGSKWKVVTDALTAFLNDPASADIGTRFARRSAGARARRRTTRSRRFRSRCRRTTEPSPPT
jgi:hypothetical protein